VKRLALTAAMTLALAPWQAHALTMNLWAGTEANDPNAVTATGNGTAEIISNTSIPGFNVSATAFGTPPLPSPELSTQTVDLTSVSAGVLYVWAWETGITTPSGAMELETGFTANPLPSDVSVAQMTVYESDTDADFDPTTLLFGGTQFAAQEFDASSVTQASNEITTITATAPYSIAVEYMLDFGVEGGNANLTVTLQQEAISEPETVVLLGLGLAGIVFLRRYGGRAVAAA
jgi:PEP-CTERM motif